ncbi:MAG: DoxX subfamily [Candidatus Cyclobacteriaceae bacterium M3_2C_046]
MENSAFNKKSQMLPLLLLRIAIGWHFFYEALVKLYIPGWSAKGYLMSSEGVFSFFYRWLAGNEFLLAVTDFLNMFGLLFVGLGLLLGLFYRSATIAGLLLLSLYYLAHPPLLAGSSISTEGSYFLINKTLIEALALFVLMKFPTNLSYGLDGLFFNKSKTEKIAQTA